jgi:hypothetical protein
VSEAVDIAKAIETQFDCATLSYVKNITRFEEEIELVNEGVFPFINIRVESLSTGAAANLRKSDAERRTYGVVITFAVRNKKRKIAIEGSSSEKGVWDVYEDIRTVVKTDLTFWGIVDDLPWKPDTSVDAVKFESDRHWIGRGAIVFDVYKDEIYL